MSTTRHIRAVRNMGGFAGGTSRLARPPAEPEEPDVRPTAISYYTVHVYEGENLSAGLLQALALEPATESGGPAGMTPVIGDQYIYLPPGTVIHSLQFDGFLYDPDSGIDTKLTILDGDADDEIVVHDETHGAVSTFSTLTDSGNPPSTLGSLPYTVPIDGGYAQIWVESTDGNALTDDSVLTIGWS